MTRRRWPSPASTATASGTEFCKCRSRPTKHTRPETRPHRRPGREKRAQLSTSVKISFVNQCYEEKAYLASNNVIPLLCFGFLPVADDHLTCFPSYGYVWCFFFSFFLFSGSFAFWRPESAFFSFSAQLVTSLPLVFVSVGSRLAA